MTELYVKRGGLTAIKPRGVCGGGGGAREIRGTKHTIIGRSGKFPRGFRSRSIRRQPIVEERGGNSIKLFIQSIENMPAIDTFFFFFFRYSLFS